MEDVLVGQSSDDQHRSIPWQPRHVLVVEDDAPIRRLIHTILRRHFNVELAVNGEEGFHALSQKSYDAVVLDLMIPRVSGFQIVDRLRSERPDLLKSIIVLTAASDSAIRRLDSSACYRVMLKPFDNAALLQTVMTCAAATAAARGHIHDVGMVR